MRSVLTSIVFLFFVFARFCSGYTITNISINTPFEDPTGITLFSNGSATVDLFLLQGAEIAIFWQFQPNGTEPPDLGLQGSSNSTVELMAGTVAAAGDEVVDILAINLSLPGGVKYLPPTTLPLGDYHFRINSSVNFTTGGPFTTQQLTARGGDLSVNMSQPTGCGTGLEPPFGNFTKVPSPSSSAYHSLYFLSPWGGMNIDVPHPTSETGDNPGVSVQVSFQFRDDNNGVEGSGISNVTVQFLHANNGSDVGQPQPIAQLNDPAAIGPPGASFDSQTIGMVVGQAYKVQVSYTNAFQDGVVSPGGLVTVTSEEFNVINSQNMNCTLLSEGKGGNSSGGGSTGSGGVVIKAHGSIGLLFSTLLLFMVFFP